MQTHPEYPVNVKYVNHGKVFGSKDWFTFYCGNCSRQIGGGDKVCNYCGAILQYKNITNYYSGAEKPAR